MKKVSTLVGIIIIIVVATVIFGGVFSYQYLIITKDKNDINNQIGAIEGELSYPSDYIPAIKTCAENILTKEDFCTECKELVEKDQNKYWICKESNYKLDIPVGDYYVFSEVNGFKAYYSEFVTCGLSTNCLSHDPIKVTVKNGQTIPNINPSDWYLKDETAGWKTFSDPQLPFTFKYPSSWANPMKSLLSTKIDISFSEGFFLEYGVHYNQNLGRPQTFDEIASQIGGSVAQRKNFNVDGKKAVEITCQSDACPQTLADDILVYGDANGNNIFISNNQGKVDPQLFTTIISSFKFIK